MENDEQQLQLARTVLQQGEVKLQAQLQAALAADQRAMVLAGMFATAAVAAFGLAILAVDREAAMWNLFSGGLAAGACLMVGAYQCLQAAWPQEFRFPGNQPDNWWSDGVEKRPLADSLKNQSKHYQKAIIENRFAMERNAKKTEVGAKWGLSAAGAGLAAAVVVQLLRTWAAPGAA